MTTEPRHLGDIEAQLEDNRKRMGHTLDALHDRLSGESIAKRGRDFISATGGDEFVFNLGRTARRNPVPLTLLGVGIGWLMLSSSERAGQAITHNTPDWNRDGGAGHKASDAAATAKSAARDLQHGAQQATHSGQKGLGRAADSASHVAGKTWHGASQAGRAARRGGTRLADGAEYMYREQPLVSSLVGLAVGAAIAASLPRSRSENRAMGSARDDFLASAQETGREKAGQAQSVAESAAGAARDAARSEADRQGLRDHES